MRAIVRHVLVRAVLVQIRRWSDAALRAGEDASRSAPAAEDPGGPPAHWLELARRRAPGLLNPELGRIHEVGSIASAPAQALARPAPPVARPQAPARPLPVAADPQPPAAGTEPRPQPSAAEPPPVARTPRPGLSWFAERTRSKPREHSAPPLGAPARALPLAPPQTHLRPRRTPPPQVEPAPPALRPLAEAAVIAAPHHAPEPVSPPAPWPRAFPVPAPAPLPPLAPPPSEVREVARAPAPPAPFAPQPNAIHQRPLEYRDWPPARGLQLAAAAEWRSERAREREREAPPARLELTPPWPELPGASPPADATSDPWPTLPDCARSIPAAASTLLAERAHLERLRREQAER